MNKSTLPAGYSVERFAHSTEGDHVLLNFPCTGERPNGALLLKVSVASKTQKLIDALHDAGAKFPNQMDPKALAQHLIKALPDTAGVLADSTGWTKAGENLVFVTPLSVSGDGTMNVHLTNRSKGHCLVSQVSGTLEEWQQQVATPAQDSLVASAAILAALAAPLLKFSSVPEGFILNLAGESSSGKTTANLAATSVWGNPKDRATWDATGRGAVEVAAAHNDLCLVLDDAEQGETEPKARMEKLKKSVHSLTAGRGRIYSKVVSGADQLPELQFRCTVLSSSPQTLASYSNSTKQPESKGDLVRFLEIAVPSGREGGIWPVGEGDFINANAARSSALTAAAKQFYGTAGMAWIEHLSAQQSELKEEILRYTNIFLRKVECIDPLDTRIAHKVALMYAAGKLAENAGVLAWPGNHVLKTAQYAYNSIVSVAFGPRVSMEEAWEAFWHMAKNCEVVEDGIANVKPKTDCFYDRDAQRFYVTLTHFGQLGTPQATISTKMRDDMLSQLRAAKALRKGHDGWTRDVRVKGKKRKLLEFDSMKLNAFSKKMTKKLNS